MLARLVMTMTFNLGIKKIWWIAKQSEGYPWYLVELRMPMPNLLWVNSETGEIA